MRPQFENFGFGGWSSGAALRRGKGPQWPTRPLQNSNQLGFDALSALLFLLAAAEKDLANKSLIIENDDATLDQKVLGLLACIAQEYRSDVDRALMGTGLSMLQLNLLHALCKSPEGTMTVTQLKAVIVEDNPNVSRTLNKMMAAGLITKQRSSSDQRTVFISITPAGRLKHEEGDQRLVHLGTGLSEGDQEALLELLKKL